MKTKKINCCMLHVAVNGPQTSGAEDKYIPKTPFIFPSVKFILIFGRAFPPRICILDCAEHLI